MIRSISEITQLWDKALIKIQDRLGEKQIFDSFFADSYINEINNNEITVVVNSALAARLISTKYNDIITEVINELTESNFRMNYILASDVKNAEPVANVVKKQVYFKDAVLNSKLTFDNFVVGDFNREASQASLFVASNPGKTFAQPLFIYSNSGLGKTHLLQAIGNYIQKEVKPGAKILYISANDFVEEYIKFVKGEKEAESLKDFFDTVDVLLLDDVQLLGNKTNTQVMFFTIYNKMIESNRQVVITSDKQPSELSGLEDRLVTRFTKGLTVKINEPDQNTCVEILKKKIIANGLDINMFDDSVLYFFAEKFSKDIRELEGALNRLMFFIITNKQTGRITMDVAADAVSSLVGGKSISTQLNEQKIINVVADYYNLTSSQLTGKIRTGQIALARHIAMYLIRYKLDVPLKKIGNMFGGKDHTTVMSAISKVEKELKTNDTLKAAIEELEKRLKA
ncbi:MAG: chromosomal replication initiator protein DnaA [Bacilli bacterium]|nr:chromosomal replication initiator protein DnaA [Bacilli bacterium]